ncbi:MAG: hypothetical protein V2J51_03425 [Erythrobacter sp.]|jgi:hypothetical protein|nr:hypothetical protein [Erythrobacter sp.]
MPPAKLKQGGPRNRADRPSWQLTEHQCRNVIARSFDAWALGLPMNRFITLAWGKAGIDADKAVWATGEFIDKAREWMRGHGYPVTPWVWVQERGPKLGQHAHILLHVPPGLDDLFRPMPCRWGKSFTGGKYQKGHVDAPKLDAAKSAHINPLAYKAQLLGKLHYMLKCAPAELEAPLEMEGWGYGEDWGQSNKVIGRRASHWQTRKGKA